MQMEIRKGRVVTVCIHGVTYLRAIKNRKPKKSQTGAKVAQLQSTR